MKIHVRRATPDDAEAISAIWEVICAERVHSAVSHPFTPEQVRQYLTSLSDREGVFVAEAGDEIVGFQSLDRWARYTDSFDHVAAVGTFVLPDWRGKGIGHRLAQHTFAFARAHGYEKLVVYVRASNARARTFYRSLGFVPKGVLSRQVKIDGQYDDEVFMEMFL
ncbi:MAG TPA: GNAT family N-acetyltransferase [Thermoflexia bacterium]|jgi:L-amino acid N-acyltransferase YncA|nr:GNAT family N-acetyltransferase [Thermoflexia bacterium]